MKILSEKDQLTKKCQEIEDEIANIRNEYMKKFELRNRRENWGMLSFVSDSVLMLERKMQRLRLQIDLLQEYKEMLFKRLHEINKTLVK